MRYRIIVALGFATAAGALLALFPGPLFKDPAQVQAERNLSEADHDVQMIELRQRAHAAMVSLQLRQQATRYIRLSADLIPIEVADDSGKMAPTHSDMNSSALPK
jgi:hypothetical protein